MTKIEENRKKNLLVKSSSAGITLIALVVTIVVLIILATISINAIFGEDGIIKRAEMARDEHRAGSVKDQIALWMADKELGDYIGESATQSKEDFLAELVEDGLLTEEEKAELIENGETTIGTQTIEFSVAPTLVEMFNAAVASNCQGGDTCTDPEKHLHVGDYLNYENPASGSVNVSGTITGVADGVEDNYSSFSGLVAEDITQTYTLVNSTENPENNKNNVQWRVMGIDKDTGGIKLVAATAIEKDVETSTQTGLYVYGAKSYLNSVTVTDEETGEKKVGFLDSICSMYANTKYGRGTVARSITAEDINEMLGITTAANIKTYDIAQEMYGSTKEYGDTFTFQNQWTPEAWEKANEDGKATDDERPAEITEMQDGYVYTVNAAIGEGAPYVTASNAAYDLIVCTELPYWLASRGALAVSVIAGFGPGAAVPGSGYALVCSYVVDYGFGSSSGEYGVALPVRPVVCLDSGVTTNDLQVYTPDSGE